MDEAQLSLELCRAGAEAASLAELRARALDLVLSAIPADLAMLHALSPRVPLSTAALRGIDPARLEASTGEWDRAAVELSPIRELASARGGVARDVDAFPHGSPGRARFERVAAAMPGVASAMFAHLSVRGRIRSVLVLGRGAARLGFSEREAALLRAVLPALSIADALHEELDQAPRRSVATRMRCEDQRLTPRQREIVEHVAMGHTNEAIADALGVSPNTLRNHLADVFRRLGAANRADVVRLAVLR